MNANAVIFDELNNMNEFKVKKLRDDAELPKRGSKYAAGYDLVACMDDPVYIAPGHVAKIGTGLSFKLPTWCFGAIFARSGLAAKRGLRPANAVGVADCDYRGEYIVALYNDSDCEQVIFPGDRIAQLVILPFLCPEFELVSELDNTDRGDGGFGSTGV